MRGIAKTIGAWATRVESWWALVLLIMGTSGFAGLGQQWDALASQGWAVVVFFGLGVACLILLVLAASLAAWRYFHPLATSPKSAANILAPSDLEARITELHDAFKQHVEEGPSTKVLLDAINEYGLSINILKRSVETILQVQAEMLSLNMINGVPNLPVLWDEKEDISESILKSMIEDAEKYLAEVYRILGDTPFGDNVAMINIGVEQDAIGHVENLAKEQRPDIDPYLFRKYHIAHAQCMATHGYILRARAETAGKYNACLKLIREKMQAPS